jgi:hypothetical protein
MSLEAHLIICSDVDLKSSAPIRATQKNTLYICAAKPIYYSLRRRGIKTESLGKVLILRIPNFKKKYLNHRPLWWDVSWGCREKDHYGDPVIYVRAVNLKPMLEELNQSVDYYEAQRIANLPDNTPIVIFYI